MKIAVISDIHGNHYALEAVMDDMRKEKVEKVFVLGDTVGYYYAPDIVFDLLEEWDYTLIKGNHESFLKPVQQDEVISKKIKSKYGSGIIYALKRMKDKDLKFLVEAPETLSCNLGGINFLLCHGAPWDSNEYLYPDSDKNVLLKTLQYNVDYVLAGHSHYPFAFSLGNKTLINSGSVGQSRSKGGVAEWVLINLSNRTYRHMSTQYDTTLLINDVLRIDPDIPYLINVLKRK